MGLKEKINNLITLVIIMSMLGLTISGCGVRPESILGSRLEEGADDGTVSDTRENGTNEAANQIAVFDTDGTEITATESVINMIEDTDNQDFISAAELISANGSLFEDEADYYVYSMLDENEQSVYNEIYAVLFEMKDDVELSTTDKEMVDHCFRCVLVDHPEIFYVTGYSISKYLYGDVIKKITLKGCYTMDDAQVKSKKELVDEYVNRVLSGISADASDYDKVKYVYEYLINNNDYVLNSENNQNILSVVENEQTVCQGYAKMTQLLLNKLGIFCTLKNGVAKSGIQQDNDGTIYDNSKIADALVEDDEGWGAHVWNVVEIDGEYYNVDTTWGDASFLYMDTDGEGYVDGPDLNYDYLCVPDSMLTNTHRANPVVDMPPCTSMNANYYVREGLYFEDVDKAQLKQAFNEAYANGGMYVNIKCADENVFEDMRNYLFAKEKVFDYLTGTSVRYVEYTNRNVLTIYL